jgi:hypothetical protein
VRSKLNFITTDNIDEILDIAIDFSSDKPKAAKEDKSHMLSDVGHRQTTEVSIKH